MTPPPFDAFLSQYASAVFERDVERCVALYADDLRVFDAWDRWSLTGRAEWQGLIAGWLGGLGDERVRVTWRDVSAWTDGDLAAGSALIRYNAIDRDGISLRALEERLSIVLRRQDGDWRVVHQHTSQPLSFRDKSVLPPEPRTT